MTIAALQEPCLKGGGSCPAGSPSHIAEFVLAGILALLGVRSLAHWLRVEFRAETVGQQALYALHVTARVGTWLALAGFFVGYAVLKEPQRFRWYIAVIPVLAGVQLLTAFALGIRSPRPPADLPGGPRPRSGRVSRSRMGD